MHAPHGGRLLDTLRRGHPQLKLGDVLHDGVDHGQGAGVVVAGPHEDAQHARSAAGTDPELDLGRVTLRVAVENLTNKVTLYNFLSTFSGTHFVAPRTIQVSIGYAF